MKALKQAENKNGREIQKLQREQMGWMKEAILVSLGDVEEILDT